MNSVMTHQFNQVPKAQIERSTFDRSHGYKTTFNEGYLIPFFVDEVLPGDTFKLRASLFARLATPIKPLMDNMYLETFFFYVPYRIIWDHWKNFMGEKVNPADVTVYSVPVIHTNAAGCTTGSIYDYMGIPIAVARSFDISALPFRAYNLCFTEWFRDQNLQDSLWLDKGDGPDVETHYVVQRINKKHDYFTSALPWPQKGTAVSLPLGSTAPVISTNLAPLFTQGTDPQTDLNMTNGGNTVSWGGGAKTASGPVYFGSRSGLVTDLTNATAATINAIREAFQLQRLYERDARGGTRYVEIIKAHFGVTSPDFRQQRPEYLGGGKTRINIHPVPQTSKTDTSPQGNLAAFGTAADMNHGFTKSFTEHGVILGLVAVRADLTYSQGLDRMWTRSTRFDFYWPSLAHLGEQVIKNKEIYMVTGSAAGDNTTFGYQERFAEYRYKPSKITGLFRPTVSAGNTAIAQWHLSQSFSAQPGLNTAFIEENAPMDRVIAVNTEPHFIFDAFIDLKCTRPMPVYSVPGMVDHF